MTARKHAVPDAAAFARFHRRGASLPVRLELPDPGWDLADLAAALPRATPVYLFETAGAPADLEQRSFLAWGPEREFVLRGDVLETRDAGGDVRRRTVRDARRALRRILREAGATPVPWASGFGGGLAGYVAYDFKNHLERLPDGVADDLGVPELRLGLVRRVVCRDARSGRLSLRIAFRCGGGAPRRDYERAQAELDAFHVEVLRLAAMPAAVRRSPADGPVPEAPSSNLSRADYDRMVARAREHILAGDIYQANLSHRFEAPCAAGGLEIYRRLRNINPSPFATFLRFPEHEVASCSPERLVRLEHGRVETRPIAGTRPRHADRSADRALQDDLLANEKERAEHLMIVDMARNDIGRVCEPGSVGVERFMHVEAYSHVQHLVTNVVGTLRGDCDAVDLLAATFPGASITGVPKIRCMQIIDVLERCRRGAYTGSAGYLGLDGAMDFNILIRTVFLQNGRAYFHVGGGIVADSDAGREYAETLAKGRAMQEALVSAAEARAPRPPAVRVAARRSVPRARGREGARPGARAVW